MNEKIVGHVQQALPKHEQNHRGKPSSWAVVAIITAGFCVGGAALVLGPAWWMFGLGGGIVIVGGLIGWAIGIMEDYTT
jgi:hypothetical protein